MGDDEYSLRQALGEPESPRGDPPVEIVYYDGQGRVTQGDGQVVYIPEPFETVAERAQQFGLVSVPTADYVAAWVSQER